jgi:DNA-binding Xre family transcriptional regulator
MSKGRLVMRCHQVMAAHGLFQTSDLVPLLAARDVHLSRQYIHKLVTKAPQRVNTDLLAALCDALDCTPNDLLQLEVEEVEKATASGETGPWIGNLRPIRARVRRPDSSA